MNVIDIILILIISASVWRGVSIGFFAGLAGFISWLGSLLVTFLVYRHVARLFESDSIWVVPLSFLGTLLLTASFLSVLASRVLAAIPSRYHQNRSNQLFGAVPGFVLGVLYASIVAGLFLLLPFSASLTAHARNSEIAQQLTAMLERVEQPIAPVLEGVNRSINKMIIPSGSSEHISLPFSVTAPSPRPTLEVEMLQLVNDERAGADLPPLLPDEELTQVARAHSADMFARSYFAHVSPDGETPFDRIREANITFLTAGENLAIAQTLPIAHEGLMNSPGHRANILRPAFGRAGIGILDGGVYGLMVTQLFRN